jgi:uncharacterized repeat protein (TIGR04076 family)
MSSERSGDVKPGESCDIKVKVIQQKGVCAFGHKVGDEWTVGWCTPPGLCNAAFVALYPFIRALQFGAAYEYPFQSGKAHQCCPDPYNQIIFELSKVKRDFNVKGPLWEADKTSMTKEAVDAMWEHRKKLMKATNTLREHH